VLVYLQTEVRLERNVSRKSGLMQGIEDVGDSAPCLLSDLSRVVTGEVRRADPVFKSSAWNVPTRVISR